MDNLTKSGDVIVTNNGSFQYKSITEMGFNEKGTTRISLVVECESNGRPIILLEYDDSSWRPNDYFKKPFQSKKIVEQDWSQGDYIIYRTLPYTTATSGVYVYEHHINVGRLRKGGQTSTPSYFITDKAGSGVHYFLSGQYGRISMDREQIIKQLIYDFDSLKKQVHESFARKMEIRDEPTGNSPRPVVSNYSGYVMCSWAAQKIRDYIRNRRRK